MPALVQYPILNNLLPETLNFQCFDLIFKSEQVRNTGYLEIFNSCSSGRNQLI